MFCSHCGKEVQDGLKFCPFCGKQLEAQEKATENKTDDTSISVANQTNQNDSSVPDHQNEELLTAFLDAGNEPDKLTYYKNAFAKYNVNGLDKFAFVWTWWGFFFGGWMLINRKLYIEGIVFFVAESILTASTMGILAIVGFFAGGFIPPFLIYKKFSRTIKKCNDLNMSYTQKLEAVKAAGGKLF